MTLNIIPPRSIPLKTGVATVRSDVVGYLREQGKIPADSDLLLLTAHALALFLPGQQPLVELFGIVVPTQ